MMRSPKLFEREQDMLRRTIVTSLIIVVGASGQALAQPPAPVPPPAPVAVAPAAPAPVAAPAAVAPSGPVVESQPAAVPPVQAAAPVPPAYPPAPPYPPAPQVYEPEPPPPPVVAQPAEEPRRGRGRMRWRGYDPQREMEQGLRPPLRYRYIEGTPLPEGYHIEHRANRGLVGGGAALFAVPYLVGAFGAISVQGEGSSGWLGIPLVGPWLALGQRESSCGEIGEPSPGGFDCFADSAGSGLLITSGVMQAVGVGMITLGLIHTREYAVADFAKVRLAPMATASGGGLILSGSM